MGKQSWLKIGSKTRTQAGQSVHVSGMVLAAGLLGLGIFLAARWGMPYGSFVLMSAFLHATAIYLIGRSLRRILDRRSVNRERVGLTGT